MCFSATASFAVGAMGETQAPQVTASTPFTAPPSMSAQLIWINPGAGAAPKLKAINKEKKMYRRILVATDDSTLSKKAVRSAIELAATINATLVALYVVPR